MVTSAQYRLFPPPLRALTPPLKVLSPQALLKFILPRPWAFTSGPPPRPLLAWG